MEGKQNDFGAQVKGFFKSFNITRTNENNEVKALLPTKNPTFIAKEVIIDGAITCESDLIIEGVVNGNINCQGKVKISGKVEGNINGERIDMLGAEVKGDVSATEYIFLGGGFVDGSINTLKADINGQVKGNISSGELLLIHNQASIEGDIETAAISVAQNAVINGKIMIIR